VEDVLNEGDMVLVKVIEVDPSGKVRLSRRAALNDPEAGAAGLEHLTGRPGEDDGSGGGPGPDRDRSGDRGERGGDRGGRDRGDRGRGHRR
jgi:polyribonucleotide nucleotidyltransferase